MLPADKMNYIQERLQAIKAGDTDNFAGSLRITVIGANGQVAYQNTVASPIISLGRHPFAPVISNPLASISFAACG